MYDKPVYCQYCSGEAEIVSGRKLFPHRPERHWWLLWICYPCDAYVGTHRMPRGKPLGELAKKELRAMRRQAHVALDRYWREGRMSRAHAYLLLSRVLKIDHHKCHIGHFNEAMCRRVIKACKKGL